MRLFACLTFALVLGITEVASANPERTLLANPPKALADFELTSHEGEPLRLSQLRGTPLLVFFGFANCPTICPAALQQLRSLERQQAKQLGKARIVVISVDGERDTPAAMKAWLNPISPQFIGLTGPSSQVREIARQFSAAFYKTAGKSPGDYQVEHNAQVFSIDAQGRLHATFFNAPVDVMANVVSSAASLP